MKKFFYRTEKGDTAKSLSERFNLPITLLCKMNKLTREIEEGDLLYVETDMERMLYSVRLFETAEDIAEKFGVNSEKILNENALPYVFYGLKIII